MPSTTVGSIITALTLTSGRTQTSLSEALLLDTQARFFRGSMRNSPGFCNHQIETAIANLMSYERRKHYIRDWRSRNGARNH